LTKSFRQIFSFGKTKFINEFLHFNMMNNFLIKNMSIYLLIN